MSTMRTNVNTLLLSNVFLGTATQHSGCSCDTSVKRDPLSAERYDQMLFWSAPFETTYGSEIHIQFIDNLQLW